jgi:hypothetical protein
MVGLVTKLLGPPEELATLARFPATFAKSSRSGQQRVRDIDDESYFGAPSYIPTK